MTTCLAAQTFHTSINTKEVLLVGSLWWRVVENNFASWASLGILMCAPAPVFLFDYAMRDGFNLQMNIAWLCTVVETRCYRNLCLFAQPNEAMVYEGLVQYIVEKHIIFTAELMVRLWSCMQACCVCVCVCACVRACMRACVRAGFVWCTVLCIVYYTSVYVSFLHLCVCVCVYLYS